MHEHDDTEGAKSACLEPREIITRHVFHHAPAALHHPAIAGHERDTEQMIFDRPKAMPQRTGRRG